MLFANLLIPIHEITTGRRQKRVFAKPLLPCILLFCCFAPFTFSSFFSLSLSLYLYIHLSLNPQRVLLRKSTIIGLLLIFENLLLLSKLVRDIGTEEIEHSSFRIVDWHFHFTKITGNPDFERRKSRDKNAFSRILVRTDLSSKKREHLSLVRLIVVATLLF